MFEGYEKNLFSLTFHCLLFDSICVLDVKMGTVLVSLLSCINHTFLLIVFSVSSSVHKVLLWPMN